MPDTLTTHPPAAAPAAGGASAETQAGPSKTGYWAAALLAVLALTVAIAFGTIGTLRTLDRPDGFGRTAIPGTLTVTGAAGGEQVVYYEGHVRTGWRRLDIRVIGPDGAAVPVSAYHGDLEYDHEGRVANAIATFATYRGGRYRVTTSAAAEAGAKLAVGLDLAGDMKTTVLWATVIALGGLLAATTIAAATRRRRSGSTR
jgi:hypothetical protein